VLGPPLSPSQGAHAFQGDGPGLVYRHASATWDESSLEERKRAMGF